MHLVRLAPVLRSYDRFAFSPSSTRRRMASDLEGFGSGCSASHSSTAADKSGVSLSGNVSLNFRPGGRPGGRFATTETLTVSMVSV